MRAVCGIDPNTVYKWIPLYEANGVAAFIRGKSNACYSSEFKVQCVEACRRGKGSLNEIAGKYNILAQHVLRSWIERYNANKERKDYDPKREVYMADAGRTTTQEERKEITEHCIAHDKDYKATAALYNVSYSQVYNWTRTYLSEGEESLVDKRGRHKPPQRQQTGFPSL